jgi:Skp family chaperone for outer membrane proteins
MEEQTNQQIIQDLLIEFKEHRNSIKAMITDLEILKANIDKLFPQKLDARYARFFEEKVKSVTEFFKTLLEMRKEIQKSLKDEIDLRRKLDFDEMNENDIEKVIDIRGLADKVQDFQTQRDKLRKSTIEKAQRETDEIASEIVTVQESG